MKLSRQVIWFSLAMMAVMVVIGVAMFMERENVSAFDPIESINSAADLKAYFERAKDMQGVSVKYDMVSEEKA
ncbi:MAG TPA: hypothetical protein VFX34_09370, partial [Sporosarcina sp.]|nr:hypothetical protein [Sporosarcina sp.]